MARMGQPQVFDTVIVGGGMAGSIVAARLAEAGDRSICVIEAGPPDRHPWIHIPAGYIKLVYNPAYTFPFKTEPGPGIAGRQIATVQGRVLGGSSSINGFNYNRGQRADYDTWAQRGNRGWGYAEEYAISRHVVDALVLPIFEGVRPILTLKVVARALLG